ncbi:Ras-like small GTPase [Novymonas esmeraldas]|uniref:Ras-like small GTPase n=1 Tax=Novymonas esmeraldas TaxID=1808958 RepID=A0AAW0F8W4_9TRYP
MEKDGSTSNSCQVHERRAAGPPVLHVNVLYGLANEEPASLATVSGPSSSTTVGASAMNRGSGIPSHMPASAMAPTSRRATDGAVPPTTVFPNFSAASGTASSSTLAKPTLDLAQVRCVPLDQWVPEAHVVNCMAPDCTNSFSLFNRKHHCRMCGRVFCSSCCNYVVYISAAVASSTGNGAVDAPAVAGGGGYGAATSSAVTPEPQRLAAVDGVGYGSGPRQAPESGAGGAAPAASPTTGAHPFPSASGANGDVHGAPLTTPASSSPSAAQAAVPCRVCASCSYEVQLVVSTRQEAGGQRRRSRGELKMVQRALLVNVLSFLTLRDLASASLVSADFYFMTRDNIIWYQYNMNRWVQERELPQLSSLKSRAAVLRVQRQQQQQQQQQQQRGGGSWYSSSSFANAARSTALADDIFRSASAIQDATALSESEAAKRVISLHARYNYTQFLDFARRQEMARCEGLSSFSLGARILLSSPIRVALVGPCGIGKTASTRTFVGEKPSQMVVRPTIGFERRTVSVRLARGLSTEVVLHLYDLSGADRYRELRRFVCRHCHVVGLCYDPARKVTLVQAADIMMELEPALGPQPVVVCGLLRLPHHAAGGAGSHSSRAGPARPPAAMAAAAAVAALQPATLPRRADQSAAPLTVGAAPDTAPPSPCGEEPGDSSISRARTSVSSASTTVVVPSAVEERREEAHGSSVQLDTPLSPTHTLSAPASPRLPLAPPPSAAAAATTAAYLNGGLEVTVDDAVGITVRGHSSIQCPLLQPSQFYEAIVQSLLDRLAEATVASTASILEISAEITMQGGASLPPSTTSRLTGAGSVPASAMRTASSMRRRPHASRVIVQELLNLTMQPCALDILLDRK